MDLQYILKILLRRKLLILTAILLPAIATFIFISQLDKMYRSDALITTGVIGKSLNLEDDSRPYLQELVININFDKQIETIQSKSMWRLLTYQLLLHDLGGDHDPFREIDEEEDEVEFSQFELNELIKVIRINLDTLDTKALEDRSQEKLFKNLAEALEYDYESITDELLVYRKGQTDFIGIEFSSEDPYLSSYVVNELTERYLAFNKYYQEKEYLEDYDFAKQQAKERKSEMDSIKYQLNLYKMQRDVVDIESQSQELVAAMTELDQERAMAATSIPANESSIAEINRTLLERKESKSGSDYKDLMNSEELTRIRAEIIALRQKYIETGDEAIPKQIELLRRQMDQYMESIAQSEKLNQDDANSRLTETLETKKWEKTLDLIDSKNRVAALDKELSKLQNRSDNLQEDIGALSRLETELEIAEKAYEVEVERVNKNKSIVAKSTQPLSIVENAQIADEAESSNRMIFTAFAGVMGGAFSVVSLLLLAFLDMSLQSPQQFKKFTELDLVGSINEIDNKKMDLNEIFKSNGKHQDLVVFKESIRNMRHILEESDSNSFLFTSTRDEQGKTFMMISLAYALTLKNKKVLLIDTNFKNNTLTQLSEEGQQKNLLTTKLIGESNLDENFETLSGISKKFSVDHVDIIGNRGGYSSPSEIFADKDFGHFMTELKERYDYIFMEGAALNTYSDTRELLEYVDKVIPVFAADIILNPADKDSINYLKSLDDKLMGAILNKIELNNLN